MDVISIFPIEITNVKIPSPQNILFLLFLTKWKEAGRPKMPLEAIQNNLNRQNLLTIPKKVVFAHKPIQKNCSHICKHT